MALKLNENKGQRGRGRGGREAEGESFMAGIGEKHDKRLSGTWDRGAVRYSNR